jgi:hypothetical protein
VGKDNPVKASRHRFNDLFVKRILSAIRLMKWHRLRRPIHIVSAVFVLSYVSFQVLDLDLSDFPLKHAAAERASVILESPETTELSHTLSEDSFGFAWSLEQQCANNSTCSQAANSLRHAPFPDIRIRLHRLTIPSSSPLDPSTA